MTGKGNPSLGRRGVQRIMQEYEVREHQFPSSNGSDIVYAKIYAPKDQRPRGVVQIAHGMAEHIGRYDDFMRFLASNGFAACGNDHIGHGRSAPEGGLGYLAARNGFDSLVTDLHLFAIYISGKYPGVPYFLLGHSMGSFAARLYLTRYGQELTGAVISGAGAGQPLAPVAAAVKKLSGSRGSKKPSKLLDRLAFGGFNGAVRKPQTPFDWLSRDSRTVESYMADPYCGFVFSASAFGDLSTGVYRANIKAAFEGAPKDLPVLMISGDRDPVGDYGRGVKKVYDHFCQAGMERVELKLYPGGRHEMLNEINKEQVYDDVLQFLQRCLEAGEGERE